MPGCPWLAAGGGQRACKDLYLGGIEAPCRAALPAPLSFAQIDSPEYPRETFPQSSDYIRHADSGTVFVVTGTISAPITCRGEPQADSRTRPTRSLRYRTHHTTPQAANKQARGPLVGRGCHVEWRQDTTRRQRLPHDSQHRQSDHLRATHTFLPLTLLALMGRATALPQQSSHPSSPALMTSSHALTAAAETQVVRRACLASRRPGTRLPP